jgi:NDP-4-keto-2,6-dideoxyhexose 3-C-methyltransferase
LSGVFPAPGAPDPSRSPLELVRCAPNEARDACGLVQLQHSAELTEMYGATYGYYSSISPTMASHLEGLVRRVVDCARPRAGDVVLDIGCNDGTLLNAYGAGAGLIRIGIDPSSAKFASKFQGDIRVVYDFFSEARVRSLIGDRQCRIITSIAMFYDLDDPIGLMREVRALLAPDGVWALELSYQPLLLTRLTYDQVCHEHVTYPALTQMMWMAKRAGLRILDVNFNDVNGGSFFLFVGRDDGPYQPDTATIERVLGAERPLQTEAPYARFRNRVQAHRDEIRHFLTLARAAGKRVCGYGASTKGNIVMNYCGVTRGDISAIGDRNPEKDGLTTPGTRIPIVSHARLRDLKPDYLLVLIWHLRSEVIRDELSYLQQGGKMMFDLPRLHVVDETTSQRDLDTPFEDLAYSM